MSCSCGSVLSGESADDLLAAVEAHIDARHGVARAGELSFHGNPHGLSSAPSGEGAAEPVSVRAYPDGPQTELQS